MTAELNESLRDALIEVIKAAGKSKAVGLLMRPELSAEDAGNWLRNCLDADRREKLSLDQFMFLLKLGRQHNCHAAMEFLGDDIGYAVNAIEPEDERTIVMREFNVAVGIMGRIAARAEKVGLLPAESDAKVARR